MTELRSGVSAALLTGTQQAFQAEMVQGRKCLLVITVTKVGGKRDEGASPGRSWVSSETGLQDPRPGRPCKLFLALPWVEKFVGVFTQCKSLTEFPSLYPTSP